MATQIVGVMLVHNEDVHVGLALRNILGFCDRIHVADHMSTDSTWEIVQTLAREHEQVDAVRVRHTAESHALVEDYAGTDTWVFGVDGDELYDPTGLARFREQLLGGELREFFSVKSNVLNCVSLDDGERLATGYLAPPSRSITKLFNCVAFDSWTRCYRQYMHDGEIAFRPGYGRETIVHLGERHGWQESRLRCLHVCFVRRSSLDPPDGYQAGRASPIELGGKRRYSLGRFLPTRSPASEWKQDKYRRGDLVEKDASPFLGPA
jgi:hypothetical protein